MAKLKNPIDENKPLTPKQLDFCNYYIELNNGAQAAIKAGYNPNSAKEIASENLTKPNIVKKIRELQELVKKPESAHIATAQDVMEFFTKVMNGEVKDQFGLDAPLSERLKAAQEVAKRTVDIENKVAGKSTADNVIEIKLNWGEDKAVDN